MGRAVIICQIVAFCCIFNPSRAKPEFKPDLTGVYYRLARKTLLADGYKPVTVSLRDALACRDNEDVCAAYPEMILCAGTGTRPCIFRWKDKKGGNVLVFTDGEVFSLIKVGSVESVSADDMRLNQ